MRCNRAGIDIITSYEGLELEAYRCPAGVWTIGYGHTGDVKPGDRITRHQAEAILEVDLDRFEEGVAKLAPAATENEFSALVSLAFNIGLTALANSTLIKKHNRGDKAGAADEFQRWVRAKGKVLAGLVKRREQERALYESP